MNENIIDSRIKELIKESASGQGIILNVNGRLPESRYSEGESYITLNLNDKGQIQEEFKILLAEHRIKAVVLLDYEEWQKQYELFLQNMHERFMAQGSVVIVQGKNAARKDILFSLISGHPVENNIKGLLTESSLQHSLEIQGYRLQEQKDLEAAGFENEGNIFLQEGNMTYQYLQWLQEYIHSGYRKDEFIRAYVPDTVPAKQETGPFMSIISRTQGKRPEALREMLLTLSGQTCLDFEVLLMGHKLTEQQKQSVTDIIDEVPDFMQGKIRLILVDDGNRTTPINRGFAAARGIYTIVLDDDDLVFDHWIAAFKEKAKECPGAVLHAYVVAQDWMSMEKKDGRQILRACGTLQNQFCKDFHWLTELNGNYCPVLGLAFPTYAFRAFGLRFDETLDTTEDWDFLMKISALCGVADIPVATSIYRLWRNAENSYSLHEHEVWEKNHKRIQGKFKNKPLLLPKEYVGTMIEAVEQQADLFDPSMAKREMGQITTLYLNVGQGYSEKLTVSASTSIALPDFQYEFSELSGYGKITALRWDPYDRGGIMIDDLQVTVTLKDGREVVRNIGQVTSNGFRSRHKLVILHSDPQVYIPIPRNAVITKVVVKGHLYKRVPDAEYEYIAAAYDSNPIQKTAKHGKRLVKKVIKKVSQ